MSGYPEGIISKYLTAALIGYKRRLEKASRGEQEIHRSGARKKQGTRYKKLEDKDSWYSKQPKKNSHVKNKLKYWGNKPVNKKTISISQLPVSAPLFVPCTAEANLQTS